MNHYLDKFASIRLLPTIRTDLRSTSNFLVDRLDQLWFSLFPGIYRPWRNDSHCINDLLLIYITSSFYISPSWICFFESSYVLNFCIIIVIVVVGRKWARKLMPRVIELKTFKSVTLHGGWRTDKLERYFYEI